MKLIFLTGNSNKLKEVKEILGQSIEVENKNIDLPEIQEVEGRIVAIEKSKLAWDLIKSPVIVEDTSLYINAWGRLPGALYKWFEKTAGVKGLLTMLNSFEDRSCIAETVIAYNDGETIETFEGLASGSISKKIKGENGFSWDKIFIPKGFTKTYAEMTNEEKNTISTRKIAIEQLKTFLETKNEQ